MPYNPGGLFSLVASYFAVPGATIRTEQHNPPLEDIASALSNVLVRDGRAPMTGPLNMNGQVINNVAVGSTPTSVATLAQATPIGGGMDYWGSTAPPLWLFAYGQAISRTTYATLFAVLGTTYGAGDGSTTFNLPDKRNRISIPKGDMGGSDVNLITSLTMTPDGKTLNAKGGAQVATIAQANLPAVDFAVSGITLNNGAINQLAGLSFGVNKNPDPIGGISSFMLSGSNSFALAPTFSNVSVATQGVAASGGSGTAFDKLPPSIVCNYIIYAGA